MNNLPYLLALPDALGTGIIIRSDTPINPEVRSFTNQYEQILSRFRNDSLVAAMATAPNGGSFDFPDWTEGLFDLYDHLVAATDGAIDPCIGEDLIRLGYSADLVFDNDSLPAHSHQATTHNSWSPHLTWHDDIDRHGTTLITRHAVHMDFGACGKGYLVDLLDHMITSTSLTSSTSPQNTPSPLFPSLVINAGGDLFIQTREPITIALEDPHNTSQAIGTVEISHGAFCASAPSRRHWQAANGTEVHHLLNALDGQPVDDVAATWVYVNPTTMTPTMTTDTNSPHTTSQNYTAKQHAVSPRYSTNYPTALADGLATALFVSDPNHLATAFQYDCLVLNTDRTAMRSRHFPGTVFTDSHN